MSAARRSRPLVVITDCDHSSIEPELRVLEKEDLDVKLLQCRTSSEVIEQAAGADALINQYAPIDEGVLASLDRCKVVVRYGVGVDSVDVHAASRHGVWVANVPDYGVEEVSDHALALLLNLLRGVSRLERAVRGGVWDVSVVRPLRRMSTLTVGVIGCGRIGGAFARKARRLGLRVLGHDVTGVPGELLHQGVREVSLEELLATSDAVSLHIPLDKGNRHFIGAEELGRMRSSAYLINTARGGLVDSQALLQALDGGEIAGAALDVLEVEPPGERDALVVHERVLVTPHAAWYSEEAYEALKTEAAREAVRVLRGERPRSPVNAPIERGNNG